MNCLRLGLLLWILTGSASCFSQKAEVYGVTTTFGKYPVRNAEVRARKSGETVYTDSLGRFRIVCNEKDVLRIHAGGFDPARVRIKGAETLTIDLIYSNNEQSREEAIQGRHISGADLNYALANHPLKGEKDYSSYTDIFSLVNSEIMSVSVQGTSILARTPGSFYASKEVLLVVNGMATNDISFISPADVKSVEYISGPDASKWGSRGANGVLEITLKSAE